MGERESLLELAANLAKCKDIDRLINLYKFRWVYKNYEFNELHEYLEGEKVKS